MSTNDKTRSKLMESMRMTKSDPGKKPEEAVTNASAKPTEKPVEKPVEKPAAKKTVEKKKPAAKKAVQKSDKIQPSQRVWPD